MWCNFTIKDCPKGWFYPISSPSQTRRFLHLWTHASKVIWKPGNRGKSTVVQKSKGEEKGCIFYPIKEHARLESLSCWFIVSNNVACSQVKIKLKCSKIDRNKNQEINIQNQSKAIELHTVNSSEKCSLRCHSSDALNLCVKSICVDCLQRCASCHPVWWRSLPPQA